MRSKRINRKITHRKRKKRTKNKRTKSKRRKRKKSKRKKYRKKSKRRKTKSKRRKTKSKRRKYRKRGKKNHRMLKRIDNDYVKDYRSIHNTNIRGSHQVSNYSHLQPQLGDCSACTLDMLGLLPTIKRGLVQHEIARRVVEDMEGSEDVNLEAIISYIKKSLGVDMTDYTYKFTNRFSPLFIKQDDMGNIIPDMVNINSTIIKLMSYLEPKYISPFTLDYHVNGVRVSGHIMTIGLSEAGQIVLFEPQDFVGTKEGKLIIRSGIKGVQNFFKDHPILKCNLITSSYVENSQSPAIAADSEGVSKPA